MVSGPYQSKLLRLLFRQCRQGLERHRRAVRQTQIVTVTGAVVGSTWVLAPLQAARRWSRRWKQQLKAVTANARQQLSPSAVNKQDADADTQDVDGLDSIVGLSSLSIAQVISDITSSLSLLRTAALANGVKALLPAHFGWLRLRRAASVDLEVEHLKRVVLSSRAESTEIAYSTRFFWVEVLRAIANLRRRKRWQLPFGLKQLGQGQISWKSLFGDSLSADRKEACLLKGNDDKALLQEACSRRPFLRSFSFTDDDVTTDDGIEVDVISSTYVEHPLEKLLNWVDQGLLWIERRWENFGEWLQCLRRIDAA